MRFSRVRARLAPCLIALIAIAAAVTVATPATPASLARQATPAATPAICPTNRLASSPVAPSGSAHEMGDMGQHATPAAHVSAHEIEFDQVYIDMMLPHHASVIALAEAALPRLSDPRLREIALAVIATQGVEIDELRGLRRAFYGAPDPALTGDALMAEMARVMPAAHDRMVTGDGVDLMDSDALVAAFCFAPDADLAFVELTIPHHASAISASEVALGQAIYPETRDIAARVIAAQRAETVTLETIRAELSAGATPGAGTPAADAHHDVTASDGQVIRALTPDEVAAIERGDGAGYARAAEANGIPGPAHALEFRAELGLTSEQVAELEALRTTMRAGAIGAGTRFLAAQAAMETDLRAGEIDGADLVSRVAELGRLEGELAAVHLGAHLATATVLTPGQVTTYNQLRANVAG